MFIQALLVALVAAFGSLDTALGTSMLQRPIVLGPLVGIVLGDLSDRFDNRSKSRVVVYGRYFCRGVYSA